MRTRSLGQSNIDASVVGFGAWAIGGWMWGGSDTSEAIEAIHAAIDQGIDLIDTAPAYGFGVSEQIVGRAIRDRRDRVVLATKCGLIADTTLGEEKFRSTTLGPSATGHISVRVYLSPDSVRREVEDSLRRMRTDRIDLLQAHWQDPTTPIEDTMATLMDLKQEGKIRAIGVCNASSAQMDRYRAVGPLDVDQEKFSMLDQDIESDQLPYCREHGLAVLAYSPLAQGLLTGKVGPEREFDEGDLRRDNPRFSIDNRRQVTAMLEKFQPVAERHGITLAQLTIAWTVAQPGVTHALCGARNPKQAQENAAAGDIELTEDELRMIDEAIDAYWQVAV